eukprot:5934455-Heterocapsa_arctica.AAC.1
MAKVASGALLAVVPPVMAYILQYRRLVVRVNLPHHPKGTCAILRAVKEMAPSRFLCVVTLLRGPRVVSTPRSLTSSAIMCLCWGPAACLRCFLAVAFEASITVLSLLTFIP